MTDFRLFASGRKKGYKPYSNMFCAYVEDIILKKRKGKKFPSMQSFVDELSKEEYDHLTTLHGSHTLTNQAVRTIYYYSNADYKLPVQPRSKVKIPEWKSKKTNGQLAAWVPDFISYEKGNIVKYNNNFYICIESHTTHHFFRTNRSKWETITKEDAYKILENRLSTAT